MADDLMFLQLMEEDEEHLEEEHLELQAVVVSGMVVYGAEELRRLRAERRYHRRLYLVRAQLLPNPHEATPWQVLYDSQNDHAFMGFNVATFHDIHHMFSLPYSVVPSPYSSPNTPRSQATLVE